MKALNGIGAASDSYPKLNEAFSHHRPRRRHKKEPTMPPTNAQLHDMGLTPIDNNDEQPFYSDLTRKKVLHDAIKASDQPNKPRGDLLWATARNASAGAATRNMCINVARISGWSSVEVSMGLIKC